MNIMPECFPCFINQALRAVKFVSNDKDLQVKVIKEVMQNLISKNNLNISPAEYGSDVYGIVRKITGLNDPFLNEKEKHTLEIVPLKPHLIELLNSTKDIEKYGEYLKLHNSAKLAGIGNIIDLGVSTPINIKDEIDRVFKVGFAYEDFFMFIDIMKKAKNVLYLTDNSGEIYFDLIFIDEIFNFFDVQVTLGVKGAPVINDITIDDMKNIAIDERINVVSNGTDAIGTVLSKCSNQFVNTFNSADVIISKGQGNYESLNHLSMNNIFYILKMKCDPIALYSGFKKNDTVFLNSLSMK